MVEIAKNVKVLVIGTCHEYQRHQDEMQDREKIRVEFAEMLRRIIEDKNISLIVEEAGNDKEVWEHLKRIEDETPSELAALFGDAKVVKTPQSTIAKQIADARFADLTHVDMRHPQADKMTIEERDEAMAAKVMDVLGPAKNVLVICGEDHRIGVEARLKNQGLCTESFRFPKP
jgi:pheromone shutdown protein TraB